MSLNIKNEETCQLVNELAELIGETKTGAITVALKDRLEREKKLANREALARHLCEIGRSCAELMGPGPSSTEHGDFLYDEMGLPK